MRIIMTALAPLECHHPRLGQSRTLFSIDVFIPKIESSNISFIPAASAPWCLPCQGQHASHSLIPMIVGFGGRGWPHYITTRWEITSKQMEDGHILE